MKCPECPARKTCEHLADNEGGGCCFGTWCSIDECTYKEECRAYLSHVVYITEETRPNNFKRSHGGAVYILEEST